jgi:hypothetical protein
LKDRIVEKTINNKNLQKKKNSKKKKIGLKSYREKLNEDEI